MRGGNERNERKGTNLPILIGDALQLLSPSLIPSISLCKFVGDQVREFLLSSSQMNEASEGEGGILRLASATRRRLTKEE